MRKILWLSLMGLSAWSFANDRSFIVGDDDRKNPPVSITAPTTIDTAPTTANTERIIISSGDRQTTLPINTPTISDDELHQSIQRLLSTEPFIQTPAPIETFTQRPVSRYANSPEPDFIESPDKRIVYYNEWEYGRLDNEFDDKVSKVARLFSNDYNAILFIAYDIKDEQYKSPQVGLQLSGGMSNGNWHNFLCTENCLNIDLNVDGKKYPNIKMGYGGAKTLLAKQPKTFLNYIKTGETIKIRVPSISGGYLVYVFEPNEILDLSQLKQLE